MFHHSSLSVLKNIESIKSFFFFAEKNVTNPPINMARSYKPDESVLRVGLTRFRLFQSSSLRIKWFLLFFFVTCLIKCHLERFASINDPEN